MLVVEQIGMLAERAASNVGTYGSAH